MDDDYSLLILYYKISLLISMRYNLHIILCPVRQIEEYSVRNILILVVLFTLGSAAGEQSRGTEAKSTKVHISYGKILQVQKVMGYAYLKVDQNGTKKWVAIANMPVKVGDTIGYDDRTVMNNFRSKTLGKTFDEIIFANEVYLKQKVPQVKSLKSALAVPDKSETVEEAPVKAYYTVEEIHRYRKSLAGKTVSVKARVYKVSRQIMKRDWVHLGDGTGNEKALTDDIVFTAQHADIRAGDEVIAKARIVVDKDFGYGYFYPVLGENATFTKQ